MKSQVTPDDIIYTVLNILLLIITLAFMAAHYVIIPAELIVLGLTIDPQLITIFILTCIEVLFKDATIVFSVLIIIKIRSLYKSKNFRIVAYSVYGVALIMALILTIIGGNALQKENPSFIEIVKNPILINMSLLIIESVTAVSIMLSMESMDLEKESQLYRVVPVKTQIQLQ